MTLPEVPATKLDGLRERDGDQRLPVFDCPTCGNRHRASDGCGRNVEGRFVHHEVADDLMARLKVGIERYGTGLQPFNGRHSLGDAYDEVLDLAVYIKQATTEFEALVVTLTELVELKAVKDSLTGKDDPRHAEYRVRKEAAWETARTLLRGLGRLPEGVEG